MQSPYPDPPYEDRFWQRVDKLSGPVSIVHGRKSRCWIWTGGRVGPKPHQYGAHYAGTRGTIRAHRYAYLLAYGSIPAPELDHLCQNKLCIRASHLEPVTHWENQVRSRLTLTGIATRKTHCPNGHRYDVVYGQKKKARRCSQCMREGLNRRYHQDPEKHREIARQFYAIHRTERVAYANKRYQQIKETVNAAKVAARTHCKQGHPLSGENVKMNSIGRRLCVICLDAWAERVAEQNRVNGRL